MGLLERCVAENAWTAPDQDESPECYKELISRYEGGRAHFDKQCLKDFVMVYSEKGILVILKDETKI